MDTHSEATDAKTKKKKKENKKNKRNAPIDRCCSWQPGGGVHLTGTRLPLMRKRNDKGVKAKKRE